MTIVWLLLAAVVIGVGAGIVVILMNRKTIALAARERASKLTELDRRYLAIEGDLSIIKEMNGAMADKYQNTNLETIGRAKALITYFEKNWVARRTQLWSPTSRVTGSTTYELEKSLTELEELIPQILK
jgi:hypothetical protein